MWGREGRRGAGGHRVTDGGQIREWKPLPDNGLIQRAANTTLTTATPVRGKEEGGGKEGKGGGRRGKGRWEGEEGKVGKRRIKREVDEEEEDR